MFGFEARAFLKRLAKLLAEEREKPFSTVRGCINARMSIAPGSRIPVRKCRIVFVGKDVQDLDLWKVIITSRNYMSSNI